jgi:hypothetical protein
MQIHPDRNKIRTFCVCSPVVNQPVSGQQHVCGKLATVQFHASGQHGCSPCVLLTSRSSFVHVAQLTAMLMFYTLCCPAGLNFLSVYAALSLNYHTRSHPTAVGLAVCSVALGAFLVSA